MQKGAKPKVVVATLMHVVLGCVNKQAKYEFVSEPAELLHGFCFKILLKRLPDFLQWWTYMGLVP